METGKGFCTILLCEETSARLVYASWMGFD